jgi:hypothetical protein
MAKVKKSKYVHRIDLNPYNIDLITCIGDKGLDKARDLLGINFEESWYSGNGIGGGVYKLEDYTTILCVLHRNEAEVIAHEGLHILSYVMEHSGMKWDCGNDESLAYLIGYIAKELDEAWNKANK